MFITPLSCSGPYSLVAVRMLAGSQCMFLFMTAKAPNKFSVRKGLLEKVPNHSH